MEIIIQHAERIQNVEPHYADYLNQLCFKAMLETEEWQRKQQMNRVAQLASKGYGWKKIVR